MKGNKTYINVSDVVKNNLCVGCGLCGVICPVKAISMVFSEERGMFYPKVNEKTCTKCGLCVEVCYGVMLDIDLSRRLFKEGSYDPVIGSYLGLYLGYAMDENVRFNATSGGVVTALLSYALEKGIIDGAIVVRTRPDSLPITECFIAHSVNDLFSAMGSKYSPVNFTKCFEKLETGKKYAIVVLPCHAYGVRKLMEKSPKIRSKIALIIGLFCGGMPTYLGTEFLLRVYGMKGYTITRLEYRGGGWPGRLLVEGRRGAQRKVISVPYPEYWLGMFEYFQPYRCTICTDGFNSWADVSVGDAWHPEIRKTDRLGSSLIITRSTLGELLVRGAFKENKITIIPISKNFVIESQMGLIKYKYCTIAIRIRLSKYFHMKIPYPYNARMKCKISIFDIIFYGIIMYIGRIIASRKSFLSILKGYAFLKHKYAQKLRPGDQAGARARGCN